MFQGEKHGAQSGVRPQDVLQGQGVVDELVVLEGVDAVEHDEAANGEAVLPVVCVVEFACCLRVEVEGVLEVALDGDLHLVVDTCGCVVEAVVDVEEEYAEAGVRWGQRGWGCEREAELAPRVCEGLQVAGVARDLLFR